ncbi:tyrosine-protein phosphatase [Streptomyces sp. NPDC060035]|uniref:tyrosine-protein phosphatase n=1 Tax=Streptomyces sp. NPDC060035 TaxID=3347044 RepID=UPI003676965C
MRNTKSLQITAATAAAVSVALIPGVATSATAAQTHRATAAALAKIPFTEATVTAAPEEDGTYTIAWKAPGIRHVAIRANGSTVAGGGSEGSVTVAGLPAADRQWFTLTPSHGRPLRLADRLIKLEGTVNFRDVGGYRTSDGHWVKMAAIYRSDSLDKLTLDDLAKLERLSVHTVYDLRMDSERGAAPDRVPAGATYMVADVLAGADVFPSMPTTADEAEQGMIDLERFMVSGATAKTAYKKVFDGLESGDGGVLFHCTSGKDRTGWQNAALLTALGVPRSTVMADYLASNAYRAEANAASLGQLPAEQAAIYKPLVYVQPEYLNAGYQEVEEEYGTFRGYLKEAVGMDARDVRALKQELLVG